MNDDSSGCVEEKKDALCRIAVSHITPVVQRKQSLSLSRKLHFI